MSEHSDQIDVTATPSGEGCQECEATGGWWFHLRRCAKCGHVGCCDSSPSQHATAHYRTTRHPIMASFEPGEDWFYDYRSGELLAGPELAPPTSRPQGHEPPWPRDLVPPDWMRELH